VQQLLLSQFFSMNLQGMDGNEMSFIPLLTGACTTLTPWFVPLLM